MGITSFLYRLARGMNDATTITSGKPKKIMRRGKNKLLGRKIGPKLFKFPF